MKIPQNAIHITELENYVFCPAYWQFNKKNVQKHQPTTQEKKAHFIRKSWFAKQNTFVALKHYTKLLFFILFVLILILFVIDQTAFDKHATMVITNKTFLSESGIMFCLLAVGLIIAFWKLFEHKIIEISTQTGVNKDTNFIAIKNSKKANPKMFYSETLNLYGRPDAIIKQEDISIPVIMRASASKVQDRHVIGIIGLLALFEENRKSKNINQKIPYGIIIFGSQKRQIKIQNTAEKEQELLELTTRIKQINSGQAQAIATPEKYKCLHCKFASSCKDCT